MLKKLLTATTMKVTTCAVYAAEHHVSPSGLDSNEGSKQHPFRTISAAARVAQPGDVVTVQEGTYRERINPPRGGTSDEKRIVYQAAPGENVVIKGSEIVKGWEKVGKNVWQVTLPNSFFGDFNPYDDVIDGEWYKTPRDGLNRHTGAVYLNGVWLDEAKALEDVLPHPESASTSRAAAEDIVLGGKIAKYAGKAIAGTDEDILYQTCRYNLTGYRLAVPDGTYQVTLKFCEPHFDAKDKRVCDVKLQDRVMLKDFDIFAEVGKFAAHDETFDGIEVTNGQLKVDIINRVSMACISGIVITDGEYSKKINCGGPAWKAYLRDPASSPSVASSRPLWKATVDEKQTTIWAQFKGIDPNEELVEINVRQSVFYPDQSGRNYITVRGFTMRHAATPWSGAMSEQIGLLGTHWSKGWIIENNVISHSMNTGITLGRYDLAEHAVDMPAATAPGFVKSCELALEHGWSREKIGSHVVRDNHISHCEKNGIHGSLGGIFSTIEGNTICDIAVKGWIGGADVAGLKLLASNDVIIRDNHIYRCRGYGGVWLDWMAQGTRFSGNLLHDNSKDLFMEVNHGPFLIDHNLFLSPNSIQDWSQGAAYAHNLIAGRISSKPEKRVTPYFRAHTVQDMTFSSIQQKDARYYNNLLLGNSSLPSGKVARHLQAAGNLHLPDARIRQEEQEDGLWIKIPPVSSADPCLHVTTKLLGKATIPDAPFEHPDGTPYQLDTDYFGRARNQATPTCGPFERSASGIRRLKVWPKKG